MFPIRMTLKAEAERAEVVMYKEATMRRPIVSAR
jgi:hypothetical protein